MKFEKNFSIFNPKENCKLHGKYLVCNNCGIVFDKEIVRKRIIQGYGIKYIICPVCRTVFGEDF